MKAEITPNVIQDLLPLYLAGEVSTDTAALVEDYLKTDPQLAEVTRQAASNGIMKEVPSPLRKEVAMEAYEDAKRSVVVQTLGLAAVIAFTVLCGLMVLALPVIFITVFK
jgi:anti-sigma factor RsiW